jgi:hypothetical protein
MKYLRRLWCKWFDHKMEIYHAGCTYSNPVGEMAGYCTRCDFDTHAEEINNCIDCEDGILTGKDDAGSYCESCGNNPTK